MRSNHYSPLDGPIHSGVCNDKRWCEVENLKSESSPCVEDSGVQSTGKRTLSIRAEGVGRNTLLGLGTCKCHISVLSSQLVYISLFYDRRILLNVFTAQPKPSDYRSEVVTCLPWSVLWKLYSFEGGLTKVTPFTQVSRKHTVSLCAQYMANSALPAVFRVSLQL